MGEIAFYIALYWTFSIAAVRLTYLGFAAGFPLQDAAYASVDARLGFDWMAWQRFLHAHPWLLETLDRSYRSHMLQGPGRDLPAGDFRRAPGQRLPAKRARARRHRDRRDLDLRSGARTRHRQRLSFSLGACRDEALRSGQNVAPLSLVGIVAFPSYHTVMAISYTFAYRRMKWLLAPVAALNGLMLAAVPFSGNHYLVDMIGACVAAGSLILADRVVRRADA